MIIALLRDITAFIKQPAPFDANQAKSILHRSRSVLILSVVAAGVSLVVWSTIAAGSCHHIFPKFVENDPDSHRGPVFDAIITILVAPLMEEFVFRWPLGFFKGPLSCRLAVWISCGIFALVHLLNFDRFDGSYPLMVILVLPQLFAGIGFAFARMKWGFWYGVFCHALHNAIAMLATMYLAIHC
jgi:membrane protease YdiL (CAAX protease family)